MSNFYVNSVKRKMKFQKLDLQSMQNNDEDSVSNVENLSPKDEIRQEESNLREEAISDLKFKLHDNFSHILTDTILPNEKNEKIEFLGERDLGLVIAKKLLQIYPEEREGTAGTPRTKAEGKEMPEETGRIWRRCLWY